MALPPLSEEELHADAGRVIIGTVARIFARETEVVAGTDREFVALLTSVDVEKGMLRRPGAKPAADKSPMYVHYRQAGRRPTGWTGDGGQYSHPPVGQRVRVFLRYEDDGTWHLLEPNGWQSPAAPAASEAP